MITQNFRKTTRAAILVAGIAMGAAACGEEQSEPTAPTPEAIAKAAEMVPADPALAQIYETTCMACHSNPDTGAPLTGDSKAWAPRLEKGKDVLLQNTIEGFKGMPPLGLCMDCSAEEFVALIDFMSEAE